MAPIGAVASLGVVVIAAVAIQAPATRFGAPVAAQRQVAIAPSTKELPPLRREADNVPSRPARVLVLGDSTAEALSTGMILWAAGHPTTAQVSTLATPGCGFVRSAALRNDDGTMQSSCNRVLDEGLPTLLEETPPDVVVVMVTWDSAEGELTALAAEYRARKAADYARLIKQLGAADVAQVLWLASPLPSSSWLGYLNGPIDQQLWSAQQDAVAALMSESASIVTMVPFDAWVSAQERRDPRALRPDGLHLSAAGGERAMNDYLAPMIVDAALRSR
jgi:lysophospholipase L1-like esterase